MNNKQAKDFLVEQTAQQAALENIPLSDLEKRMMYFTESADATEDPIALNNEFEEQYDTNEYEAKIARLLRNAHRRVKKENPEKLREWSESVRFLQKGDHYILILLLRLGFFIDTRFFFLPTIRSALNLFGVNRYRLRGLRTSLRTLHWDTR